MRRFLSILACSILVCAGPLAAASVRIYQTNSAGDAVDIIDPATNKVVMQIKDVEVPHGVAFSPDGARAYISCEAESTLWAVETKTGKLIAKAPLTGHPNNISISKDGGRVFVAIVQQPGAVDVIDTTSITNGSMKNIKSIKVKGGVHNTYVTPDGKYVLAGSIVGKMLTVIDPQTLEIAWEKPFDLGVRPIAFERNADGSTRRLFIQLSGYHGFAVVDFKTREEVQRIKLPEEPNGGHTEGGAPSHGIMASPDGKTLWVDSSIANAVFIYSLPDLKVLGYVKTGEVPDWITFTPDGSRIYIANSGSNSVSAIDTKTRKEIARIPVGEVPKRNGTLVTP
jgi:YVTN family beta-propeller protein